MPRRFRIHPAVGIARVGNAEEFFVGPEQPSVPANCVNGRFASFRDADGRIKRQAARFRVFEYVADANGAFHPSEVTLGSDVVDIEWRVHIANKKGSFFTFNGQSGAADVYLERSQKPPDALEKDAEDPESRRMNRRNASVPPDRRHELEIDPGEHVVSRGAPGPVTLTNTNPLVGFISHLGEIQIDEAGRLLVLPGHGRSGSNKTPPQIINEYANNDTWFDDVGDGSVKARVRLSNGEVVDADAAWVAVGPPDFAPSVSNAVSLYDLMWDLAVRELPEPQDPVARSVEPTELTQHRAVWRANDGKGLQGYLPSFSREIFPILSRALAVRRLHEPFDIDKASYHLQLVNWETLASQDPDDLNNPAGLREYVFKRLRDPDGTAIDWAAMPRGLGDDYDTLEDDPKPTALFSLTRVQYALLQEWSKGKFVNDWHGEPGVPPAAPVTPQGLDRAALENSVGGPFFPGIEVSWLIRRPELYVEPFRLDVPRPPLADAGPPRQLGAIQFGPGFFSQQMAQPWQADFYDCHKEEFEGRDGRQYYYMWWTAQRPDDTVAAGTNVQAPWVRHLVPGITLEQLEELETTNERFVQMVDNWSRLRFVLPNADGELEEEPL